jgi:hypothetical protein
MKTSNVLRRVFAVTAALIGTFALFAMLVRTVLIWTT